MLQLENISKVYSTGEVLKNVTCEIKAGERVGLVGANGAGKSTLFQIIMGMVEPSSGRVIKPADFKIAHLTQEFDVIPSNTVRQELARAFSQIDQLNAKLHSIQEELNVATPDEMSKLLHKMDRLQREIEEKGGYLLDMKVDKLLPAIGFSRDDVERKVNTFSGGWQMRIGIGKVMLQEPDFLLLDEPTNHIDLETIEWLEKYLTGQSVPMLVVSHDRAFLDRLCTRIIELERGKITSYDGNYSRYREQKEMNRQAEAATFERQQKELERQEVFIEKFRASAARGSQAKSRERLLDKMDLIEGPESDLRTLQFKFPESKRSGREVAVIQDLIHAYGDDFVFLGASLKIERGDKIALLGPNGSGKSTFLRLITGREECSDGTVSLGEHNVIPAYFEQNQAEALDSDKTVLDTVADEVTDWTTTEIRGLLGRFLFSEDTVFKKVGQISGGEKARLALAKMLLGSANLLILDEPTNHLDIPAKETVEEALKQFEGTVIVVSHDRYFISKVANRIVEIRKGELISYDGCYEYYLECIAAEKQSEMAEKTAAEKAGKAALRKARQKAKEEARKDKMKEQKKAKKNP